MANGDKLLARTRATMRNITNTADAVNGNYYLQLVEIGEVTGEKILAQQVALVNADGSTVPSVVASGRTKLVSASFTRPGDTAPYTALDVVSNSTSAPTILTFTNLARIVNGSGYITGARLLTNNSANTGVVFRLHLYRSSVSAIADNAPFTLLYSQASARIGSIDLTPTQTEGSGSDSVRASNTDIRLAFSDTTDANIYGILEAVTAFTPANGQQFTITLTAEQN